MTRFVLCYFWTVSHHFSYATIVLMALATFGLWAVLVVPEGVGAPFVPLLLCQMFAASSGFRQSADLGELDALLVDGPSRPLVACLHWLASAGPGIVAWAVVGSAERVSLGPEAVGLRLSSVVGLLLVSTVAWASTLLTARLLGGVGWVMMLVLVAMSPRGLAWLQTAFEPPVEAGVAGLASSTLAFIVCPFFFLVPMASVTAAHPAVLAGAGMVAVAAFGAGVVWVSRRDYCGAP